MELFSKEKGLRDALKSEAACRRHYGTNVCKKIRLRIEALNAADSLADFWPPKSGPERCHELKGNRSGIFSMDVKQPYRLLLKPIEEQGPADRSDEKERWKTIRSIELLGIEDTHG
ncbi:MAG TPA: type II toxin-antitoxin system RelE/ParE family toxin [Gemmatimonadaceae bacterium]|nr:type II toxin-antitoxin system RelE/ParE family toxin [Gemmatimonadaceae bacterium]